MTVLGRKGDTVVEADEGPRRDTSAERLAALRPVFTSDGATTAGNAPGVNDGAAALVLADEDWAAAQGLTPLARILAEGHVADDDAYLARIAGGRRPGGAGTGGDDGGRRRPVRDQRGVRRWCWRPWTCSARTPTASTCRAARSPRAPDRRLRRPPGGHAGAPLRRRGGGIGLAAICSGAGQGDAMLIEVGRRER